MKAVASVSTKKDPLLWSTDLSFFNKESPNQKLNEKYLGLSCDPFEYSDCKVEESASDYLSEELSRPVAMYPLYEVEETVASRPQLVERGSRDYVGKPCANCGKSIDGDEPVVIGMPCNHQIHGTCSLRGPCALCRSDNRITAVWKGIYGQIEQIMFQLILPYAEQFFTLHQRIERGDPDLSQEDCRRYFLGRGLFPRHSIPPLGESAEERVRQKLRDVYRLAHSIARMRHSGESSQIGDMTHGDYVKIADYLGLPYVPETPKPLRGEEQSRYSSLKEQFFRMLDAYMMEEVPERIPDFDKVPLGHEVFFSDMKSLAHRKLAVWALVDLEWTKKLAERIGNRRCLEVAAGRGWLAKALRYHGVDLVATDKVVMKRSAESGFRFVPEPVTEVIEMDALRAVQHYAGFDCLILSWPELGVKEPFVVGLLEHLRDDVMIVFVGEFFQDACDIPDGFCDMFDVVEEITIPSWPGMYDNCYILKKKKLLSAK